MGKNFFGKGATVDTSQKITVVTQFITADGTDTGALSEIRRHYVQNGKTIETPQLQVGSKSFNSISTEFCAAEVGLFKDRTNFLQKGGLKAMDAAMESGMVLVLSLWDDHKVNMLWLDSTYPAGSTDPGAARGTCSADSGKPDDVESSAASSSVTFSNIRFGEIGSTDGGSPAPPTDPTAFQACVKICQQRCSGESVVV